jgi:hypothetical protein
MTMTAPERHFPDDQEVDQWIADHFLSDDQMASPSPVVDQMKAAVAEVDARFRSGAFELVASGQIRTAFLDTPDSDRTKFRGVVRQVIVAENAGLASLCSHTQLIRSLVLVCDPPVVVCAECVRREPGYMKTIETLGHLWNYQCDRCGVRTEFLTPTTTGLGFFIVTGHLCRSCVADDQQQRAEKVVIVPPRPRPPRKKKKRNR